VINSAKHEEDENEGCNLLDLHNAGGIAIVADAKPFRDPLLLQIAVNL